VIAYANHSNWWDGLVIFYLTRFCLGRDFYCMMEEKQLAHYRFFTWLGAFSVDATNSLRAAAAVRYSINLLKKTSTVLWIFPQGRQATPHERIQIKPGADFLSRRAPQALMLPVAFRFAFFREQRPEILICVGAPHPAFESSDAFIRGSLQSLCDALDADILRDDLTGYERLMRPGWSINKLWEAVGRVFKLRWSGFQSQN
jgi:chlorobactene lauroyltransferase